MFGGGYAKFDGEESFVLEDDSARSHAEVITSLYRSEEEEDNPLDGVANAKSGEGNNSTTRKGDTGNKSNRDASPLSVVDSIDIDGDERGGRATRVRRSLSAKRRPRKQIGEHLHDGKKTSSSSQDGELDSKSLSSCGSGLSRSSRRSSSRRGSLSAGGRRTSVNGCSRSRSLSMSSRNGPEGNNLQQQRGGLDRSLSTSSSNRRGCLSQSERLSKTVSSRSLSSAASRRSLSRGAGSTRLLDANNPPKEGELEKGIRSTSERLSNGRRSLSRSASSASRKSRSKSSGRSKKLGEASKAPKAGDLDKSLGSKSEHLSNRRRSLSRSASNASRSSVSKSSGSKKLLQGDKEGDLDKSMGRKGEHLSNRRRSLSRSASNASRRSISRGPSSMNLLLEAANNPPHEEGDLDKSLGSKSEHILLNRRRSLSRSVSRRSISRGPSSMNLLEANNNNPPQEEGDDLNTSFSTCGTTTSNVSKRSTTSRQGRMSTRNSMIANGSTTARSASSKRSKVNRRASTGGTRTGRLLLDGGQQGDPKKRGGEGVRRRGTPSGLSESARTSTDLGRSNPLSLSLDSAPGGANPKKKKTKCKRTKSVCGTADTARGEESGTNEPPKPTLYGDRVALGKVDARDDVAKLKAAKQAKKSRKAKRRASTSITCTGGEAEEPEAMKEPEPEQAGFKLVW